MMTQPKVVFLQQKIMELGQALFFNTGDAVLKLPVSLVNAIHVDEVGQVWFSVSRPTQNINEFDQEFPARLEFYKKGKPFYLHVRGKANIVADPEEINSISEEIKQRSTGNMVLVKMKISKILYYPYPEQKVALRKEATRINLNPSGFIKTLQYIVKDIIPVFQSH